jgi:hypothetical protein
MPSTVLTYRAARLKVQIRRQWDHKRHSATGSRDVSLRGNVLEVKSWCRVVGGSGQAHLVTTAGSILVDEGFV